MNIGIVFVIQFSCIKNTQAFRSIFCYVFLPKCSILKNKDQNNESMQLTEQMNYLKWEKIILGSTDSLF